MTLLPEVISNEIAAELCAGHISGPFTVEEAHIIFDGHFHTSPLGLIEKVPGDRKWRMIWHLSKMDAEGESTNGWLSSDDFPTHYYSASMMADFVSANPFLLLHPFWIYQNPCSLQCDATLPCMPCSNHDELPCHGLLVLPRMPCHGLVRCHACPAMG